MKKTILSIIAAIMSLAATAQTDIWYYKNGLVTRITQVDSIVFNEPVYEYIDLGLSVKWATCNIGASKPYEYGAYFSWAETDPKDVYSIDEYDDKWTNNGARYNDISQNTLEDEDDVAVVRWGGTWRLPTISEIEELVNTDNCTLEWIEKGNSNYNGVAGYKITSKKTGYEGNSIFLPTAGYRSGTDTQNEGTQGYYWTSTRANMNTSNACCLGTYSKPSPIYIARFCGASVRAVCP